METQTIARACGKSHVAQPRIEDLATLTVEAASMAQVPAAGTDRIAGRRRSDSGRDLVGASGTDPAGLPARQTRSASSRSDERAPIAQERSRIEALTRCRIGCSVRVATALDVA